jgi:hypothetical protein
VIGIGGVTHAEKKTDDENGEAAGQWAHPVTSKAVKPDEKDT